jgi:glycosyltransferase involved in cell wall biosynthesis
MDNFDPALISVVMPCFNAAPFLQEAIDSVLAQSFPEVELIIIDDGSTDGSTEILQHFAHTHPNRITVLYQSRVGPFAARNHGLAHARGNYIAFLNADDIWDADALRQLHDALDHTPAGLAYCGWQNTGAAANDTRPQIPPEYTAQNRVIHFLENRPWPIHACLIRRQLIDDLRGFSERAPTAMDYDLWLRMLAHQPEMVRVPEVLAYCRNHVRTPPIIPRWQHVFDATMVRRDFVRNHPQRVSHITPSRLNELIYQPLLQEAYRCHWRGDRESARRLFRRAWRRADWKVGDLKHLLASLLPGWPYQMLVSFVDDRRSGRNTLQ